MQAGFPGAEHGGESGDGGGHKHEGRRLRVFSGDGSPRLAPRRYRGPLPFLLDTPGLASYKQAGKTSGKTVLGCSSQ